MHLVNSVQLGLGHGYFLSQSVCEEDISAVPYISGWPMVSTSGLDSALSPMHVS